MIFGLSIRADAAVHPKGRLSEALMVGRIGLLLSAHASDAMFAGDTYL